jgi:hypothetical protein
MSEFYAEWLDKKYASRQEWEEAWDAYWQEPVICATCVHPMTMTKDTGVWKHKEPVPWCDRMRGQRPIRPVVHHGNGQRPSTEIGDLQ